MKKILILLAVLILGGAGYYFGFGAERVTEALKSRVNTELQTLQQNGFEIEDRKIETDKEHFVLHYSDPVKISHYFKSKNVDLTLENTKVFKGLKVGVDLAYLDGVYSAVSVDLYPVAFPLSVLQEADSEEKKIIEKIIQDKLLLAHIDINKLFSAFEGYLKDIDITFESEDPLTLQSDGFTFAGAFDDKLLTSSSSAIKSLSFITKSSITLVIEDFEGDHEQSGKSAYDFDSKYTAKKIFFYDNTNQGATIKDLVLTSSGEAKDDLASSSFSLYIKSADINDPRGKHLFEDIVSKASLENLSISAIEKMGQLDENDTKGFDEALKKLFAKGITFKLDELSAKKVKEGDTGKMIDGFSINSIVKLDKITNFKQLEENPFAILDTIDAKMHIEFSDALYLTLQKQPELALAMLLFSPVPKNGKMVFDVEYKDGKLKINGKSAF